MTRLYKHIHTRLDFYEKEKKTTKIFQNLKTEQKEKEKNETCLAYNQHGYCNQSV